MCITRLQNSQTICFKELKYNVLNPSILLILVMSLLSCNDNGTTSKNENVDLVKQAASEYCNCYDYFYKEEFEKFTKCKQNVEEKWINKLSLDESLRFGNEMQLCDARQVDRQDKKIKEEAAKMEKEFGEFGK